MSLEDNLKEMRKIASEPCTCTIAQQEGTDPTVCKSCEATCSLNEFEEKLEFRLNKMKGD
jgi:hypothetical protein